MASRTWVRSFGKESKVPEAILKHLTTDVSRMCQHKMCLGSGYKREKLKFPLQDKWSAVYNVRTILLSIQSLLGEPNNDSPLNGYAAALWPNQVGEHSFLVAKSEKKRLHRKSGARRSTFGSHFRISG